MIAAATGSGSALSQPVSFADVAVSVGLVAVAMVVSWRRKVDLERDMGIATVRSFVQLIAVGYVLDYVFNGRGALTLLVLAVMLTTATLTSGSRAKRVPHARKVAAVSVAAAAVVTLGFLTVFRIVPTSARAVIPLGSMIIASAMNTASLVMTRLHDDLAANRREVEARLSLGQTSHEAAQLWHRAALRSGTLPIVDQTKVVGLVALPGAMTGMILAGASPLVAVRLQLVVMYMLLGGTACAALVAGELTMRRLFTPAHQLVRSLRRTPS